MVVINLEAECKTRAACVDGPYGVHDTMRYGIRSVAHEVKPKHVLQVQLEQEQQMKAVNKYITAGKVFGAHMPLRLQMEKALVGSVGGRHGFMPSSNLALSVLNGDDEDIDFCDILNGKRSI